MTPSNKVSTKTATLQKHFDYFLKDFEPDPDPKIIWVELGEGRRMTKTNSIELPLKLRIYYPYIVFIILVHLKKMRFGGRWEKVAWEIPIKYKGMPFMLAHRKFGFSITANDEGDEINALGIELIENMHKAIPYAEKLVEPDIRALIQKGEISIDNQYSSILLRYQFFRENAKKEFKKKNLGKNFKINHEGGVRAAINSYQKYLKIVNAKYYFITAMLDAYFSLLEHTFVLLLPFIPTPLSDDINLETFIGYNWKQKYKLIFPLTKDKTALQLLEKLDKIKEEFRNPMSHGYLLKDGNSFYVHFKNLGAIPVTLTRSERNVKYSFEAKLHFTFEDICKCFDQFDKYLKTSDTTKYGMQYIKHELLISFDERSSKQYKKHMTSVTTFQKYVEKMLRMHDDAGNMDW